MDSAAPSIPLVWHFDHCRFEIVVEDGGGRGQTGSGNQIAAPIAKRVLEAVLSR